MNLRTRFGLWLARPYLRDQFRAQHQTWKRSTSTERFMWGKFCAISALLDGRQPSTCIEDMERAEARRAALGLDA